jgi:hypothetical protein
MNRPMNTAVTSRRPIWHRAARALLALSFLCASSGCSFPLSKQALWTPAQGPPSGNAVFTSEEDSGLALFGLFHLNEPDHYAVLLERMRRRHNCARLHHVQLDFYLDHWLIVAFPISRVTAICEPTETKAAATK